MHDDLIAEAGAHSWDVAKAEGRGWRTYATEEAKADLLAWQTHGAAFRDLAKSIAMDMLAGFDTSGMRIPTALDRVVDAIALEYAEFMDAVRHEALESATKDAEWEYGRQAPSGNVFVPVLREDDEPDWPLVRRVVAGPWLPVGGTENEGEGQ